MVFVNHIPYLLLISMTIHVGEGKWRYVFDIRTWCLVRLVNLCAGLYSASFMHVCLCVYRHVRAWYNLPRCSHVGHQQQQSNPVLR
jgi:hypothetical protein